MKQFYTKPSFRFFTILIIVSAALVIHSCKKDKPELSKTIAINDPTISRAKLWYDSTYTVANTNTKISTQSIGKPSNDWNKMFKPYWAKANKFTQDGMTIVELPALKEGNMAMSFLKVDSSKFDFSKSGSLTSLLIIEYQNNFTMYAMTILADSSYLKGDYSKLQNNTYQKKDKDFTGRVYFNRMDGSLVNGWRYINGKITATITAGSNSNSSGQAIQSINKMRTDVAEASCSIYIVSTYWQSCDYWDNAPDVLFNCTYYTTTQAYPECDITDPSTGSGGGTTPPPPCVPPPAVAVLSIRNGGLVINVAAPPTGGGGTTPAPQPCPTNPPPTTPEKITDSVTNPCLRSMVEATISANVTNQINSLIQNVFGGSTTMNITFVDGALSPNIDGQSTIPTAGVVNGAINVTIQLDNTHLPSYSQQYIARVIMHEALHAYITATSGTANTTNALQHESMMQNYVVQMATSLQQMFPGLSTTDANNLALGGLYDAATYITTIETNLGLLGSFEAANLAYSIGSLGNRCN
jgi:hypothetical protein